jgi:hypothetical protein
MKIIYSKVLFVLIATFCTSCIGSGSLTKLDKRSSSKTIVPFSGKNLIGDQVSFPSDLKNEYNLIIFAFEQEQQPMVDTWINKIPEFNKAFDDFQLYEIPVIYEGSALFRFYVNNGMRTGIRDEAARFRTVTIYTDRKKFLKEMDIKDGMENIYTYLVNKQGEILSFVKGVASDENVVKILSVLN